MNEQHVYRNGIRYHNTPIGEVPGVTAVLGATKDPYSKAFFKRWRNRVGEYIANAIYENSTQRGNQLHDTIEAFLLNSKPNKIGKQAMACWRLIRPLVETIKETTSELVVEAHVHHELGFGGTPDLVCKYEDKMTVFDWKNSRKPKTRSGIKDYLQQVAAYAKAYEFTHGIKIEQAIIVCTVVPDQYLAQTDPDKTVEPELQLFVVKPKSIETHWKNFKKRLAQFQEEQLHPDWFAQELEF